MDKYESKLRLDELKQLIGEERFEEAAELADEISWKKVKNINSLVQAGEAYEKVGRYDDAREVLLTAYDRSPIGRMIIYRLAEISIRTKNFDEAQEYYDEFVDIAPHDNLRYVLRYEMLKAENAPLPDRIALLEEFKEEEYTEQWAFELAYLYHKNGDSEKCIDACDELVLWFGDGPYVEKALELKMLYQPLNKIQEQKYRDFRMKKGSYTEIHGNDRARAGEVSAETVVIPDISISTDTGRFNTVNLQQELAKSMQQIADATKKEDVSDTMDLIKKMVEEIPYLQLEPDEEEQEVREGENQELEKVEAEINQEINNDFQRYLSEEIDGQMSLMMPTGRPPVKQITGQLSIDEILADWELTRRAAEAAIADADQKKLQVEKAKALQEAEDIMKRLSEMIPQLDAGMTPKDILEEKYTQNLKAIAEADEDEATKMVADATERLQEQIDRLSADIAAEEEMEISIPIPEDIALEMETAPEKAEPATVESETEEPEEETIESEEVSEDPVEVDENGRELKRWIPKRIEEVIEEEPHEKKITPFVPRRITPEETETEEAAAEESAVKRRETSGLPDMSIQLDTGSLPEIAIPEGILDEDSASEKSEEKPEAETTEASSEKAEADKPVAKKSETRVSPKEKMLAGRPKPLTDEEKEIFSYFTMVSGMEDQITGVLNRSVKKIVTPSQHSGHLLIQSGHGNGKTQLATDFVRVLQKRASRKLGAVGRIEASALNQKDVAALVKKVRAGVLIIENAGNLSRETATKLALNMQSDQSGLLIIMEDTREGLNKALSRDTSFAEKFTERIIIPNFSLDELVEFAKAYANEQFYEIDELAVLALYDRITQIERLDEATTLTEVKEIVDDAIARAEKISFRNLFASKKSEDGDYTILREKDFS